MSGWNRLPVDEVGYLDAKELLAKPAPELRAMIDTMSVTRYTGWRNHEGRWRDIMGLDEIRDKRVLDFGCGVGLEAMQLAAAGNKVTVADISEDNIRLARRVCTLYGVTADEMLLTESWPVFPAEYQSAMFDVFFASGSLHHSRCPRDVMDRAHQLVRPGGQARLMLYSDRGWQLATGTIATTTPSWNEQQTFIRFFDAVGDWADWYDEDRLARWFGRQWMVERFTYLAPDDRYCGAVLRRLR